MSVLQDHPSGHESLAELAAGEAIMVNRIEQTLGLAGSGQRTAAPHKTDLELDCDEPASLRRHTELLTSQPKLRDIHGSLRWVGR
jgi:hypothetical protein